MRQPLPLAATLCLAAAFATGCGTMKSDDKAAPSGLDGSAWTMALPAGASTDAKALPTLRFEAGRASGSDGCNRFNAPFTTSPGKLQFGSQQRASTLMVCPTEDGAQMVRVFEEALSDTRAYRIEGTRLLLLDAAGATLLSFDAQATGLAGTAWRVGGYNNGQQAVVSVIDGTRLNVAFGSDGKVSGNGGCNSFSGSWRLDGKALTIGPWRPRARPAWAPRA